MFIGMYLCTSGFVGILTLLSLVFLTKPDALLPGAVLLTAFG